MPHLIDVWLLDICNTLSSRLAQLILQRLFCPFQVVLLQEGKDGLQEEGLLVQFSHLFHSISVFLLHSISIFIIHYISIFLFILILSFFFIPNYLPNLFLSNSSNFVGFYLHCGRFNKLCSTALPWLGLHLSLDLLLVDVDVVGGRARGDGRREVGRRGQPWDTKVSTHRQVGQKTPIST